MCQRLLLLAMLVAALVILRYCRSERLSLVARKKLRRFDTVIRRRRRQRAIQAARPPPILADLRNAHAKFVYSGDWSGLLELGDMYRKGSFPTHRPDTDMALQIFKMCGASPDGAVAGAAQVKFIECRTDQLREEDIAGVAMPRALGEAAVRHAENTAFLLGTSVTRSKPIEPIERQEQTLPSPPPPPPPPVITSDAQNVHDHGVSRSVAAVVDSLPSAQDHYEDVLMHVLDSEALPDAKADAVAVLDALTDDNRDVLSRVWSKIQTLEAPKDAADILVGQLASGVEHGSVVCASGQAARIVGALDGLTESFLKPLWAVREEIGTLAASARDAGKSADDFATQASKIYAHLSPEVLEPVIEEYKLGFD